MERILKFLDIYGREFNLLINGKNKFRSVTGGLLSIMTVGVLIWSIISFGRDFFNKKNPKVNIGDGIYSNDNVPILNGSTYQEKYIILQYDRNYDKVFRPYLSHRIFNTTDYSYDYIKQCPLEYLTQKNIITGKEDFNYDIFTFYCVRMNDYILGGWAYTSDSSFHYPVSIYPSECKNTPLEEIEKYNLTTCDSNFEMNLDKMLMTVWYEKIGFVPDSKLPFINKIKLKNFFLKHELVYNLEFPINIYELKDDDGYITENINTSFDLNFDESLFYELSQNDVKNFPSFSINFYISDSNKTFSRSYQKLQDLLALIGGFMKLQYFLVSLFEYFLRTYLIDSYIVDEVFENFEFPPKMNYKSFYLENSIMHLNKNQSGIQNLNSSIKIEKEEKLKRCSNTELNVCSNSVEIYSKGEAKSQINSATKLENKLPQSLTNNNFSNIKFEKSSNKQTNINLKNIFSNGLGNDMTSYVKTKRMTNLKETNIEKDKNNMNLKKNLNMCSYIRVIISMTFNRKFNSSTEEGSRLQIMKNKIQVSDILRDYNFILNKLKETEVLKQIVLNPNQALCLNYLQKPNDLFSEHSLYNFSTLLNSNENNTSEISNYFIKLLEVGDLEGNDKILFDGLDSKIKTDILKKLNSL